MLTYLPFPRAFSLTDSTSLSVSIKFRIITNASVAQLTSNLKSSLILSLIAYIYVSLYTSVPIALKWDFYIR